LAMNGTSSKKTELFERDNKTKTYRRIVTGNVNGRAVVQSDEPLPAYEFRTVPGYEHTLIWVNPATPDLSKEQRFDIYPGSVVPGPGGTSLHFVTFPPSSVFADPSSDGEAARNEALVRLRGLADHFEKEDPAMHKTNTVDYALLGVRAATPARFSPLCNCWILDPCRCESQGEPSAISRIVSLRRISCHTGIAIGGNRV
ncbi:MAG: hypothetical protein WB607_18985, partial [Candidatus Acidiferrum sp.]